MTTNSGKTAVLIWDLDGTIIDSYRIIVPTLHDTFMEYGFCVDEEEIHEQVISSSVTSYIRRVIPASIADFKTVYDRFWVIRAEREPTIRLIPHVKEALQATAQQGVQHCIYTHSRRQAKTILRRLEVYSFFKEIVTSDDGFARKPAPDAINNLIEKYGWDRDQVYYIGDRTIDTDCARNAGVKGVLYLPEGSYCRPNGSESFIIHDMREIIGLAEEYAHGSQH